MAFASLYADYTRRGSIVSSGHILAAIIRNGMDDLKRTLSIASARAIYDKSRKTVRIAHSETICVSCAATDSRRKGWTHHLFVESGLRKLATKRDCF